MVASEILGGLGSAIGGIANLFGAAGEGGKKELQEAIKLWENLQDPDYDMTSLKAPQLALVARYFPETYEAKIPDEVKTAQDSPELREAQKAGVQQLMKMAQEGLPTAERAMVEEAQGKVRGEVGRARQQAVRNLQETGRMSGGSELAAGLAAAQQGSQLARQQGTDVARMALENRMNALTAGTSAAGQARGQDIALSQANADTINRFNQWKSQLQTEAAANAAQQRNQAGLYNVTEAQRVADANTAAQYNTQLANIQRQNALREALANFQMGKVQGQAGALTGLSQAKYAEQAARAQQIQSIGQGIGSAAGGVLDIYGGGGGFAPGGFSMAQLYEKPKTNNYYSLFGQQS